MRQPWALTRRHHSHVFVVAVITLFVLAVASCRSADSTGVLRQAVVTDPVGTPQELPIVPPDAGPGPGSPLPTPTATPTSFPTQPARPEGATSTPVALPTATPAAPAEAALPQPLVDSYEVVATYPHDPDAFTQGLVWQDGIFYEGTGLRGRSSLRKVDPASGEMTQGISLPDQYFGEGIAILGDRLYQLTWQENTGFIYDKDSFELLDTWSYPGEGWGLTTDGERLIMSDGTDALRFLNPETLEEIGRVAVTDPQGNPVVRLNELEYVDGEVLANIWQTDWIARIDPTTGLVTGWIDLRGLLADEDRTQPVDVLNGIAYDPATDRLFVTGKLWPKLFEIDLVPASQ